MIVRRWCLASIPLAISLMTGHAASAQTYPTRPITVIVPFGPGAATDMIPRLLSDGMAKTLGQPIIIDNRTGAGGTTGTAAVARAAPDGYTLLATVAPTITVNVFVQKNVPYDPRTAFAPVAVTANSPLMLAVHPSLPAKTVAEFVEYAKSNPGKISYGTPGAGTAQNILGELIKRRAGIDIVEIPYRGAANLIPDLVSGQLQAAWGTPFTFLPLAQDGKIRILGITDTKAKSRFAGHSSSRGKRFRRSLQQLLCRLCARGNAKTDRHATERGDRHEIGKPKTVGKSKRRKTYM